MSTGIGYNGIHVTGHPITPPKIRDSEKVRVFDIKLEPNDQTSILTKELDERCSISGCDDDRCSACQAKYILSKYKLTKKE